MSVVMNIFAVVGFIVGLIVCGIGVVAAMDPEGRGGNYILGGLAGLAVAIICAGWLLYITAQHFF